MVPAVKMVNSSVRFICTDEGRHAPIHLGTYYAEYALGAPDHAPVWARAGTDATFVTSRKTGTQRLTGGALKMDEQCPRCHRHPKYNAKTLRKICAGAAAAPYDERGFALDVSLGGHC